jgi:glycerophosphoryl diester phosphodiesterase
LPALRLAHRGDWRRAPENTIAAFLAALDVPGCDGLEFDVRAAAGGVPVVIHDDTLDRVQGVPGRVASLTPEQLARHGVSTLEEVLAAVPRRAFLDVELKGDPGRGAVDALTAGRGPGLERAVVSSFEGATLARVGRLAPSWPRWLNAVDLAPETIAAAVALECRGIAAEWRAIDPRSAGRVLDAGLELAAWTVRRRPTFARLERLGIVAVCVEARALDGQAPSDTRGGHAAPRNPAYAQRT